jgi:predicted dehydrogenase
MDRIRVGVLGFGRMGQRRVASLLRNARAQVVAIYDPSVERRAKAESIAPGAVVKDEQETLVSPGLDAVFVSTPNSLHAVQTLAHLKAGQHVFCEKPLCLSGEEAVRIINVCQERRLDVQVGANARYFGSVQMAKKLLDSGAIGGVTFSRGWIGHDGWILQSEPWSRDLATVGGGTLFDNGHHFVDLVQWFFGDVGEVTGFGATRYHKLVEGQEDNFFAILESRSGVTTMFQSSWSDWNGYFYLEVYGREGLLQIDARGKASNTVLIKKNRDPEVYDFSMEGAVSFDRETDAFLDCIRRGGTPSPNATDGAKVIEVCRTLYKSWKTGSRLPVHSFSVNGGFDWNRVGS